MIKKVRHMLWKTGEMELVNPTLDSSAVFFLSYGKVNVGTLTYNKGIWLFKYSEEYKNNNKLNAIIDFPDKQKGYESKELWPFFASRIPSINQPFHFKKINKAKISITDTVGLLKLFGNETITNPFQLQSL